MKNISPEVVANAVAHQTEIIFDEKTRKMTEISQILF